MSFLLKPATLFVVFSAAFLTACYVEDPGPRQSDERTYAVVDFDRLEIGSGLHVNVVHGNFYSVSANGDRRNIEDLIVEKQGTTLVIRYRNGRDRKHDTYVDITAPELQAVDFSGGTESKVSGFVTEDQFRIHLSGGSLCQLDIETSEVDVVLSGGSYLNLRGEAHYMVADVSGASALRAFNFPLEHGNFTLTGASDAQVAVTGILEVIASGASHLVYRGTPELSSEVSGASSVHQE